jgi:transposase
VGTTKRGKGTKLMALADASGLPLGVHAASASPHEVTLVEATLAASCAGENPERLIGDRAYDSDPLDEALAERGIEMIAPHRRNRKKLRTQDGRKLRRYKRRWKMERLFAWLGNFLYGIKRALEIDGVPPPGNANKGGEYWHASYLRNVVLDDVYTPYPYKEIEPLVTSEVAAKLDRSKRYGIYWFNRTRTTRKRVSTNGAEGREYKWRYFVHKNPREQWIAIPIPEAGIPRELVEAAREMIHDNRQQASTGRRFWQIPSGTVRCSGCGTCMTKYASAAGGRIYSYYRCARLARLGKDSCPSLEGYRSRKNHRAEHVERLVWEFVSDLMKDPARLRDDLERMIELEKNGAHGDPEIESKAWLDKLAELDRMRQGFQEQAARGYMTLEELGVALDGLAETRRTAERELAVLQSRRETLEQLELDKEALLEHYARIAPEALDSLTLEERHRLYKMLRLEVAVRRDSSLEVRGVFGEVTSLSDSQFVPRL